MLTWIHLKDFVLIDHLELELAPGMTALTGETGAGKSILVDAIGLALGDRADAGVVRRGAERAEVHLGFDLARLPEVRTWLAHHDLADAADAGECQLRRTISREGRSRAWINGHPCPIGQLRELGEQLVAIHGQHAHQGLLKRSVQLALLDRHADVEGLLDEMRNRHAAWRTLAERLEHLRSNAHELRQRIDFLRYQVEELEALSPQPDEAETLRRDIRRLGAAGELQALCAGLVDALYEAEDSAWSRISRAGDEVARACGHDPAFEEAAELRAEAAAPLEEAVSALRRLGEGLEPDPPRLEALNARLAELQRLARKHGVDVDELPALLERLQGELETLTTDEGDVDRLSARTESAHSAASETAERLHARREAAARSLARRVNRLLGELGMPDARFRIRIDPDPDRLGPQGMDRVEFEVRTNAGQDWGPLSRIASGGELSRIGLALQLVLGDAGTACVRIFDEVDAGIGGGVAEIVGRRLRELAGTGQVLCVTHLPQVAAQAHHHLRVEKQRQDRATRTHIHPLSPEERIEEIARMLGGVRITESTRAHAEEMLAAGRTPA